MKDELRINNVHNFIPLGGPYKRTSLCQKAREGWEEGDKGAKQAYEMPAFVDTCAQKIAHRSASLFQHALSWRLVLQVSLRAKAEDSG